MQKEDFPALPGSSQPQSIGGQTTESAVNTAIGSIGTMPGPPLPGSQQNSNEGKDNTTETYCMIYFIATF